MELLIDLEFSEDLNEFRHNKIDAPTGDFKVVVEDVEYSEARKFIDHIRGLFERPLEFDEVIEGWNKYKLNNNL